MTLSDKVAIVTGSGRGLGRAYGEALAAQGAAVVVNDLDLGAGSLPSLTIEDKDTMESTTKRRFTARAPQFALGLAALIAMGAGVAAYAASETSAIGEIVAAGETTTQQAPAPTLPVPSAAPTVTAKPCPARATLPCT